MFFNKFSGAGAGWFCRLFEGSLAKGPTNYDGEVLAVCEATTQLLSAGLAPEKFVFFIDSQAAILALSSNTPTNCLNTIQYRTKIAEFISYGWTTTLQWAKQVAESTQLEIPLNLRRAKNIISTYIGKYTAMT
ncbi:reverse transcriptase [Trichonephila clavipes]|nr:reverse transcriptase [Trichonephila clavipes]